MTTSKSDLVERPPAEEFAEARAKYLVSFVWHLGSFVIINVFLWMLDIFVGQSGVQWAFWITLTWGFAVAFHGLAFLVDGRQLERRKAQQYLEQEHHPRYDS